MNEPKQRKGLIQIINTHQDIRFFDIFYYYGMVLV